LCENIGYIDLLSVRNPITSGIIPSRLGVIDKT
jgi:hypothetical protein